MKKACGKVEWSFLEHMMVKMGFDRKWVDTICISSVSYSVIINGSTYGSIMPSRGLRQGDPLFPYLFLICTEGLLAMLSKALSHKSIHGVSASKNGP